MNQSDSIVCPKCQTVNPAGSKFCSNCAAPLGPAAAPPPPPPPPDYRRFQSAQAFGAGAKSRQVAGTPDQVHAAILAHLQSKGAEIHQQIPGSMIQCALKWKNLWVTSGFNVDYKVSVTLQPAGPDATTISVSADVDWSSTIKIIIISLCLFVLFVAFAPALFGLLLLILIVSTPLGVWGLMSMGPKEISEEIFKKFQSVGEASMAPSPIVAPAPPPPAAPSPAPSAPAAPPPLAQAGPSPGAADAEPAPPPEDVMDRIGKLAKLRDVGAITEEEFEKKKAELLSRI